MLLLTPTSDGDGGKGVFSCVESSRFEDSHICRRLSLVTDKGPFFMETNSHAR